MSPKLREILYDAAHVVGILAAGWAFYHQQWRDGIAILVGLGLLRVRPPERGEGGSGPPLPVGIACLAFRAFGGCGPDRLAEESGPGLTRAAPSVVDPVSADPAVVGVGDPGAAVGRHMSDAIFQSHPRGVA